MKRTVKAPEVRRAEILDVAGTLFENKGFSSTSVDEIVRTAGVAKGTFYYYFKSKEDVLDALVQEVSSKMAEQSQAIADEPERGAIEKICAIVGAQKGVGEDERNIVDEMHRPENRELHDRLNIETVRVFGAILATVIEQGNKEGVFQVDDPLSTIQFILAGSQLLFGYGVFNWTPAEETARKVAMLTLIERAFAAPPGSFAALMSEKLI